MCVYTTFTLAKECLNELTVCSSVSDTNVEGLPNCHGCDEGIEQERGDLIEYLSVRMLAAWTTRTKNPIQITFSNYPNHMI